MVLYQEPLQEETRKSLEYHFRTATFQILDDISNGLRNVLGHLIQVLCIYNMHYYLYVLTQEILLQRSVELLLDDTLGPFLKRHFDNSNLQQVFSKIGIQRYKYTCQFNFLILFCFSIADVQLASFEVIELKRLYSCLVLFVEWLQGGLYDFSALPAAVFKHMKSEDQELIQQFNEKYSCMLTRLVDMTAVTLISRIKLLIKLVLISLHSFLNFLIDITCYQPVFIFINALQHKC